MRNLAIGLGLAVMAIGLSGPVSLADELPLPTISVSPASYDFGNVPTNAMATGHLMVTNTGGGTLIVNAVKTKAPFGDGATSFTLGPGESRRVDVYFTPTAPIQYNSVCTFQSNAANNAVLNVPLSGMGVQ